MGTYGNLGNYGSLGNYGNLGETYTDSGATWGDLLSWGDLPSWFAPGTVGGTGGSTVTRTRYILVSPVREVGPLSRDPYAELLRNRRGNTVVKRGGQWFTVRNKRQNYLDGCTRVLRGGYENEVTLAERNELVAAGYTVRTETTTTPGSGFSWDDIAAWSDWGTW
jgi:hypothetical protein